MYQGNAAAQDVVEGMVGTAGIRHQQQFDSGAVLQQLAGQVGEAPDAGHRIGDFARPLLCKRNQLRQGLHAERRRGGDEHRLLGHEPDRHEIARHLGYQIGGLARRGQEHRERRHIKRVAIGRSVQRGANRDRAAAARLIDGDNLMAPALR
jgi:hypothetical protein